jgi:hypothetical protein
VIGCNSIILTYRWRDIVVLNVHAATEHENYNTKDSLYEEIERRELKSQLGRPVYGREDNIKMDLREIGWSSVEWIHLAQDRE